jgi:hypothetical protein
MALNFSGFINPFDAAETSNALGVIDTERGKRSLSAMRSGQQDASRQLDEDTATQLSALQDASIGRDFGQNLDAYDTSMGTAQDMTQRAGQLALDQANAGTPDQVQANLNPQMQRMLGETLQKIQGGAGAALQSSAATRNAANAVAGKAGDLWQQAFNNTMQQAGNNLNVAQAYGQAGGQVGNLAEQQLAADNAPMEDWLNLKNDIAMQRYAGNVGLTQAAGQAAGEDNSFLGHILGAG